MNILDNFRSLMKQKSVDYFIVKDSDEHSSEYVNDYFKFRTKLSGFTGSNGTLLIGLKEAWLFTDGRYFVQAQKELEGTDIKLMRMGTSGVPTFKEFLSSLKKDNVIIGTFGKYISYKDSKELKIDYFDDGSMFFDSFYMTYGNNYSLLEYDKTLFSLDDSLSGESSESKLQRVRDNMNKQHADYVLVSALDSCMWLLNIRGKAIPNNPVTYCYILISNDKTIVFIDKFNDFHIDDIFEIRSYDDIFGYLKTICSKTLIFDSRSLCAYYGKLIEEQNNQIFDNDAGVSLMKAIKNPVETQNIRKVYLKDSCIVSSYLKFIKNSKLDNLNEYNAGCMLDEMRLGEEDCFDLSFDTISAMGPNAAMMHYSASKDNNSPLYKDNLYLVDSGGQWIGGTTDVTRTVILGTPTEEMKHDYTLVLKGLLKLQNAVFLEGCTGLTLDMLARESLWKEGKDYKCGTGHGIGYMLNVHEGPQSIRPRSLASQNEPAFKPGMIVSDEPGVYKEGKYGVRLENILLCVEKFKTDDGLFLGFEPLTYVPFDEDLINRDELSAQELDWLDDYQQKCEYIHSN